MLEEIGDYFFTLLATDFTKKLRGMANVNLSKLKFTELLNDSQYDLPAKILSISSSINYFPWTVTFIQFKGKK